MDAYHAIVTKRDTREYGPQPISDLVLRRILQAGRMAGSSKNTQPCRFVIVRGRERLEAIATCGQFASHVPGAALAIAVVLTPGGGAFDAGRAAQNIMVAAWAEGITSCATSMHNADCARTTLALPEGHSVAILLPLGYPADGAHIGAGRARLPLEDMVMEDRWHVSTSTG